MATVRDVTGRVHLNPDKKKKAEIAAGFAAAEKSQRPIQGPVRPTTDVAKFRKTGVSTRRQGAVTPEREVPSPKAQQKKQGFFSRALDVISAPLSQPRTTFTQGLRAGAEAVRQRREDISTGEKGGAGVIATTVASTVIAAGVVLGANALIGLTAKGGAVGASAADYTFTGGIDAYGSQIAARAAGTTGFAKIGSISLATWGKTLAGAWIIDNFILSPTETATWAGVDNVAGAVSFQVKTVVDGVEDGTSTRADAEILIADAKVSIDKAKTYVNWVTMLNPKAWSSRGILMEAIDTATQGVLLQEARLAEIDETAPTFQEAQAARDLEFKRSQEERDRRYQKQREEAEARSAEDTLFFEALRARNNDETLTPEQIQLLESRGIFGRPQETGGRSALDFGLLR